MFQFTIHQKNWKMKAGNSIFDIRNNRFNCFSVINFKGLVHVSNMPEFLQKEWARREGFSSFPEADLFYAEKFGIDWKTQPLCIVQFEAVE
jgi:hypothetical protein